MNSLARFILIILFLAGLAWGIYWLWQRQPRLKNEESKPEGSKQVQIQDEKIKPADFSILTSQSVKIEGKTNPQSYVAIYSNAFGEVVKTDKEGKFEKSVNLEKGLNLVQLVSISPELKDSSDTTLTYWVGDASDGKTVYAGSIKSILVDNLTVSTSSGEKTIKTSKTTTMDLPPQDEEKPSTKSVLSNLRVGDYLIALGDLGQDYLNAKKIQVIRENKPQVTKKLFLGRLLVAPKNNIFSAKAQKDQKIEEFTLAKNSKEAEKVVKDKDAIIFYHDEKNQKVVDLIYLLP